MRTYKLLLLLLFSPMLHSQIEFMPIGATYSYLGEYEVFETGDLIAYISEINVLSDTTINGQACRKVSNDLTWPCDDAFSRIGFLYEEDRRVYHWNRYSETFDLLYDFSKTTGESWVVPSYCGVGVGNCSVDSFMIAVDSISFVEMNGLSIQVQHASISWLSEGWGYGATIYEGIGSLQHFFFTEHWWCITAHDYIRGLRCFDSPVDGLFTFYDDEGDCDTVVALESVADFSAVAVFPNPANDQLTILGEGVFDVALFDAYGRLLQQQTAVQQTVILDLDTYASGYYLVRIKQGSNWLTEKVIKK